MSNIQQYEFSFDNKGERVDIIVRGIMRDDLARSDRKKSTRAYSTHQVNYVIEVIEGTINGKHIPSGKFLSLILDNGSGRYRTF